MSRGRKPKSEFITIEQRLEQVNKKISDLESTIKELKSQKKKLEKEIEDNKIQEIRQMIDQSGKSLEDVKKFLAKK